MHVEADPVGVVAARSAANERLVGAVRAGLVADGAVDVGGLRDSILKSRVYVDLLCCERVGLQVGGQLLKLALEEAELPAKRLLGLQGEGQGV
jgi:hypothetical protein